MPVMHGVVHDAYNQTWETKKVGADDPCLYTPGALKRVQGFGRGVWRGPKDTAHVMQKAPAGWHAAQARKAS